MIEGMRKTIRTKKFPHAPPQAPIDPLNKNITNIEIRKAFEVMYQVITS